MVLTAWWVIAQGLAQGINIRQFEVWSPEGLAIWNMLGTPQCGETVSHPGSAPPLTGASSALLTDVVDGASTELPVELLGSQAPQVMDGERPEVQHVVSGEGIPLLHHDHFGP